jgi:GT2 family glycosyltransferase
MLPDSPQTETWGAGPEASVIVPVRNGEKTLGRALQAIAASRGVGKLEVIVVDDASSDSSAAIASSFSCKVICCGQGAGPAAARNRGAQAASARKLIFVDADVFVRPDTLSLLLNALDHWPAAFATYDPEPLHRNFATRLYHALSCLSLEDTGELTPVFYSYCASISKDLFLRMGGFDASFTSATFEDMELGWRLAARGLLSHHIRTARVDHAVRYTLPRLARAYFRKSRDLAFLLLSHHTVTFDDQGWTRRKHWATLICAWATLGVWPLAVWLHPLWGVPWVLAMGGFTMASLPVYRAMAQPRWIHGPLSILAYLGIHLIATAAMLSGGWRFFCRWLTSAGHGLQPGDEKWVGGSQGGVLHESTSHHSDIQRSS